MWASGRGVRQEGIYILLQGCVPPAHARIWATQPPRGAPGDGSGCAAVQTGRTHTQAWDVSPSSHPLPYACNCLNRELGRSSPHVQAGEVESQPPPTFPTHRTGQQRRPRGRADGATEEQRLAAKDSQLPQVKSGGGHPAIPAPCRLRQEDLCNLQATFVSNQRSKAPWSQRLSPGP